MFNGHASSPTPSPAAGRRRDDPRRRRLRRRADPDLPGDRRAAVLAIAKAVGASSSTCSTSWPRPAAGGRARRRTGCCGLRDALRRRAPAASRWRRSRARAGAAALRRGVRAAGRAGAGGGRSPRALPATPRAGRGRGVLDGFDARLPFRLTDGQREVGARDLARPGAAPPDAPAAAGRGRLRQDGRRPAGDARGRRRRRAGGAAGAHRGARPAAPPLDHRDARRPRPSAAMLGGADIGTRVALLTGSHDRGGATGRRCSTSASGDAGIVIGTHALLEEQGAVLRPRAGRRRRAAPVRRRAARRAARQGRDEPAARPGDDRDADPADRRDDRVRRPRRLHADRAAGRAARRSRRTSSPRGEAALLERAWERIREEVAAGRQAYVVCPRIGDGLADEADDVDGLYADGRPAAAGHRGARRGADARRGRRWPACGSRCCTAGCRRTTRTT